MNGSGFNPNFSSIGKSLSGNLSGEQGGDSSGSFRGRSFNTSNQPSALPSNIRPSMSEEVAPSLASNYEGLPISAPSQQSSAIRIPFLGKTNPKPQACSLVFLGPGYGKIIISGDISLNFTCSEEGQKVIEQWIRGEYPNVLAFFNETMRLQLSEKTSSKESSQCFPLYFMLLNIPEGYKRLCNYLKSMSNFPRFYETQESNLKLYESSLKGKLKETKVLRLIDTFIQQNFCRTYEALKSMNPVQPAERKVVAMQTRLMPRQTDPSVTPPPSHWGTAKQTAKQTARPEQPQKLLQKKPAQPVSATSLRLIIDSSSKTGLILGSNSYSVSFEYNLESADYVERYFMNKKPFSDEKLPDSAFITIKGERFHPSLLWLCKPSGFFFYQQSSNCVIFRDQQDQAKLFEFYLAGFGITNPTIEKNIASLCDNLGNIKLKGPGQQSKATTDKPVPASISAASAMPQQLAWAYSSSLLIYRPDGTAEFPLSNGRRLQIRFTSCGRFFDIIDGENQARFEKPLLSLFSADAEYHYPWQARDTPDEAQLEQIAEFEAYLSRYPTHPLIQKNINELRIYLSQIAPQKTAMQEKPVQPVFIKPVPASIPATSAMPQQLAWAYSSSLLIYRPDGTAEFPLSNGQRLQIRFTSCGRFFDIIDGENQARFEKPLLSLFSADAEYHYPWQARDTPVEAQLEQIAEFEAYLSRYPTHPLIQKNINELRIYLSQIAPQKTAMQEKPVQPVFIKPVQTSIPATSAMPQQLAWAYSSSLLIYRPDGTAEFPLSNGRRLQIRFTSCGRFFDIIDGENQARFEKPLLSLFSADAEYHYPWQARDTPDEAQLEQIAEFEAYLSRYPTDPLIQKNINELRTYLSQIEPQQAEVASSIPAPVPPTNLEESQDLDTLSSEKSVEPVIATTPDPIKPLPLYDVYKTLSSKEKVEFRQAYIQFATQLHQQFNQDERTTRGLQGFLLKEGGIFCLDFTKTQPLFDSIMENCLKKLPVNMKWKELILRDTVSLLNTFWPGKSEPINRKKSDYLLKFGDQILEHNVLLELASSLLKIKTEELLHHARHLDKEEVPTPDTPCLFFNYIGEDVCVTPLMAHFDEKGRLFALRKDKEKIATKKCQEVFHSLRQDIHGRFLVDQENIEELKKILEAGECPFILLEQRSHSFRDQHEPLGRKEKKEEKEVESKPKTAKPPKVIGDEDFANLEHITLIKPTTSVKSSSSLTTSIPDESILIEGDDDFWKSRSLETFKKVYKKTQKKDATKAGRNLQPLRYRISEEFKTPGVPEKIPLFNLGVKAYQKEGIEFLRERRQFGISGILAWPMGFGKTLGTCLAILDTIASGNKDNIMAFMPNAVQSQFKRETVERIADAQFFTLYASLLHWNEFSSEEQCEKLTYLENFLGSISDFLDDKNNVNDLYQLELSAEESKNIKRAICLAANLPIKEKRDEWLKKLQLNYHYTGIILQNVAKDHVIKIFDKQLPEKQNELLERVSCLLSEFEQRKEAKDANELAFLVAQKVQELKSKKNYQGTLNFLNKLFSIHPDYSLDQLSQENFPGKDLESFVSLVSFPCNEETLVSYSFDKPLPPKSDKHPRLIFTSYHELSNRKGRGKKSKAKEAKLKNLIEEFIKNHCVSLLALDEVHTLINSGAKSDKNANLQRLIKGLGENNPDNFWPFPISGTFVRGDFAEFIETFSLCNPDIIPKATKDALCDQVTQARQEIEKMRATGIKSEKGMRTIALAYAHVLSLNFFYSKTAHKTDEEAIAQWDNRIPEIIPGKIKMKERTGEVSDLAKAKLQECNDQFKTARDINKAILGMHSVLRYAGPENIAELIKKIETASSETELDELIANSYMATALFKEPEFISLMGKKKKVIIVARYDATCSVLQAFIKKRFPKINASIFNYKTNKNNQQAIIDEFNQSEEGQALILTYKKGGVGLNLAAAEMICLAEDIYDPSDVEQAIARVRRVNNVGKKRVFQISYGALGEKNYRIIKKSKVGVRDFLTKPFSSHEEHFKLFIQALQGPIIHKEFHDKRSRESIKETRKTLEVLTESISLEALDKAKAYCDAVNPFFIPSYDGIGEGKEKAGKKSSAQGPKHKRREEEGCHEVESKKHRVEEAADKRDKGKEKTKEIESPQGSKRKRREEEGYHELESKKHRVEEAADERDKGKEKIKEIGSPQGSKRKREEQGSLIDMPATLKGKEKVGDEAEVLKAPEVKKQRVEPNQVSLQMPFRQSTMPFRDVLPVVGYLCVPFYQTNDPNKAILAADYIHQELKKGNLKDVLQTLSLEMSQDKSLRNDIRLNGYSKIRSRRVNTFYNHLDNHLVSVQTQAYNTCQIFEYVESQKGYKTVAFKQGSQGSQPIALRRNLMANGSYSYDLILHTTEFQ